MIHVAIYGFIFTKKIIFPGGVLIPIFDNLHSLKKNNTKNYFLTGFVIPEVENYNGLTQLLFDLAAVLSFIEQRDVIICGELENDETPQNFGDNFPRELKLKRIKGPGAVIIEDSFSATSRERFINLAMVKLNENINGGNDVFRTSFFKSMLPFREPINYIDVNYYLNFSALESLSRHAAQNFKPGKSPAIITCFLKSIGFNVDKETNSTSQRNIMHYCKLRNALFHNGDYEAYLDDEKPETRILIKDYSSNLSMLLSLVLIKCIKFDDEIINWDSWIDRHPFIHKKKTII